MTRSPFRAGSSHAPCLLSTRYEIEDQGVGAGSDFKGVPPPGPSIRTDARDLLLPADTSQARRVQRLLRDGIRSHVGNLAQPGLVLRPRVDDHADRKSLDSDLSQEGLAVAIR